MEKKKTWGSSVSGLCYLLNYYFCSILLCIVLVYQLLVTTLMISADSYKIMVSPVCSQVSPKRKTRGQSEQKTDSLQCQPSLLP